MHSRPSPAAKPGSAPLRAAPRRASRAIVSRSSGFLASGKSSVSCFQPAFSNPLTDSYAQVPQELLERVRQQRAPWRQWLWPEELWQEWLPAIHYWFGVISEKGLVERGNSGSRSNVGMPCMPDGVVTSLPRVLCCVGEATRLTSASTCREVFCIEFAGTAVAIYRGC